MLDRLLAAEVGVENVFSIARKELSRAKRQLVAVCR
jgi:hypothetical protein